MNRKHRLFTMLATPAGAIKATAALLVMFVALAGCVEHGGQVADADVLTADESLLRSIEEEYGVLNEDGTLHSISDSDASMAWDLTKRGERWTVEDVRRNPDEALRVDQELALKWTREHLARLEGPRPPPASEHVFGPTLAEEVAGAKHQIRFITNWFESERQDRLPPAEQLDEAEKYLAELKGPSPPSYPYLWSWDGTLEDEITTVEERVEWLRRAVQNEGGVR